MKIVQPTTSEQEILIIPRESLNYNNVTMIIKKDGQRITETINDLVMTELGNYFSVLFSSTILEEGFGYSIELVKDGNLIYRDKLYATSQSDFTTKHKQSQNKYTEIVDDNTYIL